MSKFSMRLRESCIRLMQSTGLQPGEDWEKVEEVLPKMRKQNPGHDDLELTASMGQACSWSHTNFTEFQLGLGVAATILATNPPKECILNDFLPFPSFLISLPQVIAPRCRNGTKLEHLLLCTDPKTDFGTICVYGSNPNLFSFIPIHRILEASPEIYRLLAVFLLWYQDHAAANVCAVATTGKTRNGKKHGRVYRCTSPLVIGKDVIQYLSNTNTTPQYKLEKRFMVRGHIRDQPHGPGRRQRKRIWIAPHMKGPEGAERWARTFECR